MKDRRAVIAATMPHALCEICARTRRLDERGRVVTHYLALDVSAKAVRTVGAGRVRRRCPGSGRPPRPAH
jgi:hypothetical protein